MKKAAIILIFAMVLCFFGCGGSKDSQGALTADNA